MKDAVWATLKLVEHPGAIGQIFNIGGKEGISIGDLARRVKEVLESPSQIVHIS